MVGREELATGDRSPAVVRPVAVVLGVVALASMASLIAFFVVGGPFGMINDIGNAVWRSSPASSP